ncbi:hypothetical protein L2E82_37836 [Cichorium intybus]|uniref:Uncharacterized protein n=1 Tax=Cichorium intybus TaxID=13427 RepID=A0ACB9AF41_CICIN|nr:hypothetical protein L2E82_37836 [Cichorium intybus]
MPIIFCRRPISTKSTKSRTEVSVEEDEYPESDLSTPEYIAKKDLIQLQSKMATVSTQLLESIAKNPPVHFDPGLASPVISQIDRSLMECPMPSRIPTIDVSGKTLMSDSFQPLHHNSIPQDTNSIESKIEETYVI